MSENTEEKTCCDKNKMVAIGVAAALVVIVFLVIAFSGGGSGGLGGGSHSQKASQTVAKYDAMVKGFGLVKDTCQVEKESTKELCHYKSTEEGKTAVAVISIMQNDAIKSIDDAVAFYKEGVPAEDDLRLSVSRAGDLSMFYYEIRKKEDKKSFVQGMGWLSSEGKFVTFDLIMDEMIDFRAYRNAFNALKLQIKTNKEVRG